VFETGLRRRAGTGRFHAAVPVVGGWRWTFEAADRPATRWPRLGKPAAFFSDKDGDQRVPARPTAFRVSSSIRAILAARHRFHHRARQPARPGTAPSGDQPWRSSRPYLTASSAVPRRALHHQRGVAGRRPRARCSDSHVLRRARHAEQQQRPVGGQRGHRDLDEGGGKPTYFGGDHGCRRGAVPPSRVDGHRPRGTSRQPGRARGQVRRPRPSASKLGLVLLFPRAAAGPRSPGSARHCRHSFQLLQHVVAKKRSTLIASRTGGGIPRGPGRPVVSRAQRARIGPPGEAGASVSAPKQGCRSARPARAQFDQGGHPFLVALGPWPARDQPVNSTGRPGAGWHGEDLLRRPGRNRSVQVAAGGGPGQHLVQEVGPAVRSPVAPPPWRDVTPFPAAMAGVAFRPAG